MKSKKPPAKKRFSARKFKQLKSFEQMVQFAKAASLPLLGQGSGRIAFAYSGGKALKIGLNEKGFAQNAAEKLIFDNQEARKAVPTIHDFSMIDNKVVWLISQIAREIKSEKEFCTLVGFQWETFIEVVKEFARVNAVGDLEHITGQISSGYSKRLQQVVISQDTHNIQYWTAKLHDLKVMQGSDFMKGIISAMRVNRLMPGDLDEIAHFGKTTDGRVVLMDSGFTEAVAQQHYKPSDLPCAGKTQVTPVAMIPNDVASETPSTKVARPSRRKAQGE